MKQAQTIFKKTHQEEPEKRYTFKPATAIRADDTAKETRDLKRKIKKENVTASIEEEEKLRNLTVKSNQLLFKCTSFFPFDFFPDQLTIEPTQINIYQKTFFLTQHLLTIPIQNISDIHVQTSIFFASLTFIDRSFADNTITIKWIKKDDAYKVRKMVQGLIIAKNEDINVEKIDIKVLRKQSEKLGNMHQIEK